MGMLVFQLPISKVAVNPACPRMRTELEPCRAMPGVADVRVLGAIGVVEMENPVDVAQLQKQFVDLGVWIRPFGKLVYLMPPYIIDEHELAALTDAINQVMVNGVRFN